MEKNTGKKFETQGKHGEFYLSSNVATLYSLSHHKGEGRGYIAALVIDDYPAGEGWARAVRTVNTRLGVPISGSTGCTPTSNYGGCDQICLPSGNNNQKRCACATGFVLKSDGTGCEGEYFLQQLPKSFEMKAVYVVENVNMVYFYLQITVDWMEDLEILKCFSTRSILFKSILTKYVCFDFAICVGLYVFSRVVFQA